MPQPARTLLTLLLAVLAASCGSVAGVPCISDNDCISEQTYCRGFSNLCPGSFSNFTVSQGACHRDCSFGACACVDDTDCRAWETCSQGTCVAGNPGGITCPKEPTTCPPGCILRLATDRTCTSTCQCDVCPASDGGPASDSGPG